MRRKNKRVGINTVIGGFRFKPGTFDSPELLEAVKEKFESDATSSEIKLPYGDISARFLRRLASRILHGTNSHGRGNYLRGLEKGTDINFLRDRYNHAMEHLIKLREGTHIDDHIGAVAWFLMFATIAEEQFGVDWCEILTVVTPEREKEKQYGLVKKDRTSARKSRSRRDRV